MFKISSSPAAVNWPVTIPVPVDGGKVVESVINVRFLLIDHDDYRSLAADGDRALMQRVIIGWDDSVLGADDQPLEFDQRYLNELLKMDYVVIALVQGYTRCRMGAPEKN